VNFCSFSCMVSMRICSTYLHAVLAVFPQRFSSFVLKACIEIFYDCLLMLLQIEYQLSWCFGNVVPVISLGFGAVPLERTSNGHIQKLFNFANISFSHVYSHWVNKLSCILWLTHLLYFIRNDFGWSCFILKGLHNWILSFSLTILNCINYFF
jgi:hypothetical protein